MKWCRYILDEGKYRLELLSMKLEAQTFCDVLWQGRECRFALAVELNLVCFWESHASPQERLFVVLEELYDVCSELKHEPITLDGLQRRFLFKLSCGERGQRAWARVVALDDKTDVLLHPSGRGEIRVLCSEPESYDYLTHAFQENEIRVPFLFDEGMEVVEWSLAQWQKQLRYWKTLPQHDFAFALAWLRTSDEEKQAQLCKFSRGNQEEMDMVLEWIACLESNELFLKFPDGDDPLYEPWVSLEFSEGKRRYCQKNSILSEPRFHTGMKHFPALWQTWFDFFGLSLNLEVLKRHISAYQDVEIAEPNFSFIPESCTAHEYLEARLQLRDWLRERVGLDEERIKQLLT